MSIQGNGAVNPEAPAPYDGLDLMPIAGEWREGRSGDSRRDVNPYTGETLLGHSLADADDLDEAYRAAVEAQREWSKTLPQERRDLMERVREVVERRMEEIVGWLVRESGSTRVKAELEAGLLVREGLREAATYPLRMTSMLGSCTRDKCVSRPIAFSWIGPSTRSSLGGSSSGSRRSRWGTLRNRRPP